LTIDFFQTFVFDKDICKIILKSLVNIDVHAKLLIPQDQSQLAGIIHNYRPSTPSKANSDTANVNILLWYYKSDDKIPKINTSKY